jgi:S1-C subfamily serine protease
MNKSPKVIILVILLMLLLSPGVILPQILSPADIMEKYGKAVVVILTIKAEKEISLGSGFIIRSDGVIVTNYHVIEGAYPAQVKLKSGDIYDDIGIINIEKRKDIAIIKIKGFGLTTVPLGNSDNIRIGERLVVIGNPHGFENTVSDGLLSQLRDTGNGYMLHQISAPISAGSSGSPVFNLKGEVIGIATLSDIKGQNINFSVPINYARGMIDNSVKYSLKELTERESGITVSSKVNQIVHIEEAEIIRKFLAVFVELFQAQEECSDVLLDVAEKNDVNQAILGSTQVNISFQNIKIHKQELGNYEFLNSTIDYFRNRLLSIIVPILDLQKKIMDALETTTIDINGNRKPNPDMLFVIKTIPEINALIGQIDSSFMVRFVELIKSKYQNLESFVLPGFLSAYEYRDMTPEEIKERANKSVGTLGVRFRSSTREPVIWYTITDGPAEKAGFKRDDIILGLVSGRTFNTQMDFQNFRQGTKPGDIYTFRVRRGLQEIQILSRLI